MIVDTLAAHPVEDSVTTMIDVDDYEQPKADLTPVAPALRRVPDSLVNRLKQTDTFAYANDPEYWTREPKETQEPTRKKRSKSFWELFYDFFSGAVVRTITYIILGLILVWIIYRIVVVNNLFMTASSRRRTEITAGVEDEVEEGNLESKIQAAIRERNYRAAIRFMYLLSLRSLHEKGWIRYHAQGTNYEYLSQVQPYGVGNEFRFLTHVYEYVWYGEFALSEEQFGKVNQQFQQFFNAVKP